NAQVLKSTANDREGTLFVFLLLLFLLFLLFFLFFFLPFSLFELIFRVHASDNAICGEDVQDIEPLDRGNHQRVVTHRAVWFLFAGPRHMCVRLSKGQKLAKLKVFDAGLPVASDDGQRGSGLRIYLILERPREAGTKAMGTSVVVKSAKGLGGHKHILLGFCAKVGLIRG